MKTAGLVDLQVNGFAGVDFNCERLTAEALDHALEAMLKTGVTTCLPTLITAHESELAARFAALDAAVAKSRLGPLMCPGYHLEGPFLNPSPGTAGCHPKAAMTAADAGLVERLEARLARPILLVTVAPEVEGGLTFIAAMKRAGKVVALGHCAPDFALAAQAAAAGATLSTHLGNASPREVHKFDNPTFAQLAEDRLCATFIADGVHVPAQALKVMVRAKGLARSILVTDAVLAAAAPPGTYDFADMQVEHGAEGTVRVPGSAVLAGSALSLDQAVRNVVAWGIAAPLEAMAMACAHPAKAMAEAKGFGRADSEIDWSDDLRIARVRVGDVERHFAV